MIVTIYGHNYQVIEQLLRPHFSLKELANNQGDPNKPQFIIDDKVDIFLDMLQDFRLWLNKPMIINSCYRQKEFNDKTPHADKRSAHLHACAVDWAVKGHTEAQRQNVANKWKQLCAENRVIGAVNFYKNGYHLEAFSDKWYGSKSFQIRDCRGTSSDW